MIIKVHRPNEFGNCRVVVTCNQTTIDLGLLCRDEREYLSAHLREVADELIKTEVEDECGRPCSPDNACDECEKYWKRMRDEGLWDKQKRVWTDKGWKEIVK